MLEAAKEETNNFAQEISDLMCERDVTQSACEKLSMTCHALEDETRLFEEVLSERTTTLHSSRQQLVQLSSKMGRLIGANISHQSDPKLDSDCEQLEIQLQTLSSGNSETAQNIRFFREFDSSILEPAQRLALYVDAVESWWITVAHPALCDALNRGIADFLLPEMPLANSLL